MTIYDFALALALVFFIVDVVVHTYLDMKEKKQKRQKETELQNEKAGLGKIDEVHAILIDNSGYLAIYRSPVESSQHVFCERMRSFCNSNCQFFATSITDNDIQRGKPRFDCWMMPVCYQAKEMHDWRNTNSCQGPKSVR